MVGRLRAGTVTTQQAVMLTRCTGSLLVKHTPEERMALCDEVCNVLQAVGGQFCWQWCISYTYICSVII